jgi:glycosyl transferase family 25
MIEQVVYINLDHRTDRREQIEKELHKIPCKNIMRFSAIRHTEGAIGCTKSHIAILKMAISSGWKNVLILEDDMVFKEEKWDLLYEKMTSYDSIVLGGMLCKYDKDSLKLTKCYGTGAYLVNSSYYTRLLQNFEEGLRLYIKNVDPRPFPFRTRYLKTTYAIDTWWNNVQQRDNWFLVQMMYSPPSYSDVTQDTPNYIERFIV